MSHTSKCSSRPARGEKTFQHFMCFHVLITTSRGRYCQRWEQHTQWFNHSHGLHFGKGSFLSGDSEAQNDFFRSYTYFCTENLTGEVGDGWSCAHVVRRMQSSVRFNYWIDLNRRPVQTHLMLSCVSTNGEGPAGDTRTEKVKNLQSEIYFCIECCRNKYSLPSE